MSKGNLRFPLDITYHGCPRNYPTELPELDIMVQSVSPKHTERLLWVDLMKAVALIWIFLNHASERLFGFPFFANPEQHWPAISERIRQLFPISGDGFQVAALNLLRWVGWTGDVGVQLFLILSGFGLTWGLLKKGTPDHLDQSAFYGRRLFRIFPQWWLLHLLVLPIVIVRGTSGLDDYRWYLSLVGIRVTPGLLYFIQPAWWFIGLLLQLYIVFPWLWSVLRKRGTTAAFILFVAAPLVIRLAGLLIFEEYLDAWSRGAIFVTRLPEFAFGMILAERLHASPPAIIERMTRWSAWFLGAGVYTLGLLLSFSLAGMALSTVLLGAGAFLILMKPLNWFGTRPSYLQSALSWTGRHSYSLFLVQDFFIRFLVPSGYTVPPSTLASAIALAFLLTLAAGSALDWVVDHTMNALKALARNKGVAKAVGYCVGLLLFCFGTLIAGELAVRTCSPQEVFGWGERPALEPHTRFGWRLIPSQSTRLQWESYDYVVSANSLGFPGKEYPATRSPNSYRILVTGDAFTSAEGVDTENAWPRLIEQRMNATDTSRKIEVLNFAITGYGPQQEQAVIDSFVPTYHPDLVLIQMFVNDFEDALISNDRFMSLIGFGRLSSESVAAYLSFAHLKKYIKDKMVKPAIAILRSNPSPPYGYYLGHFSAFDLRRRETAWKGKNAVRRSLEAIRATARDNNADLLLLMVPAPIQVCQPKDLSYYPRNVDLSDTSTFDLDLPQRTAHELAESLGIEIIDLRKLFAGAANVRSYQPDNEHWTAEGHQLVADYLTQFLNERMAPE
jgi:peptidoglycan/LPS O-acetylase OafA/YrhL/lysophospholipase L1-like esterase